MVAYSPHWLGTMWLPGMGPRSYARAYAGAPDSSALYAVWRCGNSVELKDSTCSMAAHEAPESAERQTEMFHLFHLLPILPGCAKSGADPLRTTDPWQLEPKP